jgi:hypothetical protein
MDEQPTCLWCGLEVSDWGDTCNLVCYGKLTYAINMVTYLKDDDYPPKDLHLQPWAEALHNTQEG